MDLTLNEDQLALQTAVNEWCRAELPFDRARQVRADLWPAMTGMGLVGMTGPALGLDHATEATVFAELGAALAPVALLSSAVAARWTDSADRVGLALPGDDAVRLVDAAGADRALGLFDGAVGLVTVPAGLAFGPGMDPTTTLARVTTPLVPDRLADPRAALHLQLVAAAFAVGCADAARDMATDYAKLREQFGRPIGWFQAIKHMCADMAVRASVARSQLYFAACALDEAAPDVAFHVAAAKRLADQAAIANGRTNIQIHGGIGMTDEAAPHLCLKRAHLLQFVAPADNAALLA